MQINSIKTIMELSRLNGRVFVHLSTDELAEQFMRQAEAEGFTFGDGAKPTDRDPATVIAVNPNHTINYVGFIGMIAFGIGSIRVGRKNLIRVRYVGNGEGPHFTAFDNSSK